MYQYWDFFPDQLSQTHSGVFYQAMKVMGAQFWKADGGGEAMLWLCPGRQV